MGIPQDSQPYIYYRGQRMPAESDDFFPVELHTEGSGQKEISIDIVFSQPIDPRSVKKEKIFINKKALPASSSMQFNKEGTLVRIVIKGQLSYPFSFSMESVRSYNGTTMEMLFFGELGGQEDLQYDKESGQWKKF